MAEPGEAICEKLDLDFGLDFRIGIGIGTYDYFSPFVFPYFSLFSRLMISAGRSETKSGSCKAFGLMLCFPRGKSESEE